MTLNYHIGVGTMGYTISNMQSILKTFANRKTVDDIINESMEDINSKKAELQRLEDLQRHNHFSVTNILTNKIKLLRKDIARSQIYLDCWIYYKIEFSV